jgi:hypothetical protein
MAHRPRRPSQRVSDLDDPLEAYTRSRDTRTDFSCSGACCPPSSSRFGLYGSAYKAAPEEERCTGACCSSSDEEDVSPHYTPYSCSQIPLKNQQAQQEEAQRAESSKERAEEDAKTLRIQQLEARVKVLEEDAGKPPVPESVECVICKASRADTVMLDCAHLVACYPCASTYAGKPCPMCRQPVSRVVRCFQT